MEEEFDDNDEQDTIYAVLYDGKQPVSTGRFLPETQTEARLTRIATLKGYRGNGYGTKIIIALENYAKENGYHYLTIHAELTAKDFYQTLGYQAIGNIYMEDGESCQTLEKYLI